MEKSLVNHCHKQNTIGCDENIDFVDTEEHMKTVIIGIAGGTGSGKSTFTNRLKDEFKDQVAVLYHDNYYRAQDDIPFEERKKVNYDHPDAFETELLIEHIKQLKEGHAIQCPVYDYAAHNRSKEVVEIQPKRVIRDVKERGRDLEGVVDQYLTTVKPMHYLYVEPTRALADVVINSGMNPVAFEMMKHNIQILLDEEV